jgi:hypothetical protein
MAVDLPKGFQKKRALLYDSKANAEDKNAVADAFMESGRYGEALEFLEVTRDAGRLEAIETRALDLGDTFLLARASKLRGVEPPVETWRRLGERALSLGKYYDAFRAFETSGDPERAESVRQEHIPEYTPFRPEGK